MTSKALIITSQKNLSLLTNIFLNNGVVNLECFAAESVSMSVDLLEQFQDFDLIFVGHKIQKDMELKELARVLKPVIENGKAKIYGTNKAFKGKKYAKYYNQFYPITKILIDIYEDIQNCDNPDIDYIPFSLLSLMEFDTYPFDCFSLKNNNEFERVFKEGEDIEAGDILGQRDLGTDSIYISKEKINKKITVLENALKLEDENSCVINPKQSFSAATEYALDILESSGIDIPEGAVQANLNAFKDASELAAIYDHKSSLKTLFNKASSFYVKHVSMTCLMSQFILKELEMGDQKTINKFLAAANFQNIFLKNSKEFLVYEDAHLEHFEPEDQERISKHAQMAYELLRINPLFDQDVLLLIREQHGQSVSHGFPETLSGKTKLSIIFQIATLFSQRYLIAIERSEEVDTRKIVDYLHEKLTTKDAKLLKAFKKFVNVIG